LLLVVLIAVCGDAEAARISDIAGGGMLERAARFFTFQDPSLRYALAGSILLGLACGLMGCFLVVRKLALMSDALSHAVLPGVAIGFLWNMTRDPVAIFIGATLAGLLGAATAQAITTTTRHKEDAALGFVLAAFFAVGVCLLTMIQNLPEGNKSGLDKFLFGQAAAMGAADVGLLGVVALLAIAAVALFYKEFLVTSFDAAFARSAGIPVQFFHYALMLLLAFSIVASLQAVGVVLVAAMLVIPAAAAFLLTDRLGWMLMIASLIGMLTGIFFLRGEEPSHRPADGAYCCLHFHRGDGVCPPPRDLCALAQEESPELAHRAGECPEGGIPCDRGRWIPLRDRIHAGVGGHPAGDN
jgi:manganese/zinc/iron transport system permease protein